jgi:hypothetical protein
MSLQIVITLVALCRVNVESLAQQSIDSSMAGNFQTHDGRASIFFPCKPSHSEVTAKNINKVIIQYSASSNVDKTTYFLMYFKLEDTTAYHGEEDILDRGPRPELSIWAMCEIVSRQTSLYHDHPCEEVHANLPGGNASAIRRTLVVNDMVYDLLVIYPTGQPNVEMNNKFFASFSFVE